MLVQFIDHEGDPVWINPLWVRTLGPRLGPLGGKKKDGTTVRLSSDTTSLKIDLKHEPADVADALNAAIMTNPLFGVIADDDRKQRGSSGGSSDGGGD